MHQEKLTQYAVTHGYIKLKDPRPFQVIFHLSKPVAGYGDMHLDALLQAAVVYDTLEGETLPPQATPYQIPVPLKVLWQSAQGVPLYDSSNLTTPGSVLKSVHWWVKSTGQEEYLPFANRKKDGSLWQPDEGSGVHKAYRVPLPTTQTPSLVAFGVGDMGEVGRLLEIIQMVGFGKKRGSGFGKITSIEILPGAFDTAIVQGGMLTRPVPLLALDALGLKPNTLDELQQIAFSPPYWLPANFAHCLPENTPVTVTEVKSNTVEKETESVSDFLYRADLADKRRALLAGQPIDVELLHRHYEPGKGIGQPCAITAFPISGGAVKLRNAVSSNMGNVVDFTKSPESGWVSNSAALVLSDPKKWHRNMVALESGVLWPTLAVDANNPAQERPLWREVFIDLVNHVGQSVVAVFTTDPKSRWWPRCRVGRVGTRTPFYVYDPDLSISALLEIDAKLIGEYTLFIEKLLEYGFGKNAILQSLHANLEKAVRFGLAETRQLERQLQSIRPRPEFSLAWRAARELKDIEKRGKDVSNINAS
jgi:hypothetical protein